MTETLKIVYEAIDELNETLDAPLEKSDKPCSCGRERRA